MTEPINLTELRALTAERHPWSGAIAQLPVEVEADELLALIDTAEAARETVAIFDRLNKRTRGVAPSYDIGPEFGQLQTANARLRDTLTRYTT